MNSMKKIKHRSKEVNREAQKVKCVEEGGNDVQETAAERMLCGQVLGMVNGRCSE